MYHHITRDQRTALTALLRSGYSQRRAARELSLNQSSISRELARNRRADGSYQAPQAHLLTRARRRQSKFRYRKIENDSALASRIEMRLDPLISPEVIAQDEPVSHEAIYAWIYRSRPDLKMELPQRGRKRRRYGSKREQKQGWTKDVRAIEERPAGAEHRSRTHHFEGDTLRGTHGALLTHTDRKSRFEIVHKVASEGADEAHRMIVTNPHLTNARTITYDRGSTFALWRMIERDTTATVYFANARHPWERGTNENTNGRLRRVYPKGFDFGTITQQDLDAVVWRMNHTKRKCLDWRTPCEMFRQCCTSD